MLVLLATAAPTPFTQCRLEELAAPYYILKSKARARCASQSAQDRQSCIPSCISMVTLDCMPSP